MCGANGEIGAQQGYCKDLNNACGQTAASECFIPMGILKGVLHSIILNRTQSRRINFCLLYGTTYTDMAVPSFLVFAILTGVVIILIGWFWVAIRKEREHAHETNFQVR